MFKNKKANPVRNHIDLNGEVSQKSKISNGVKIGLLILGIIFLCFTGLFAYCI